MELFLTNAGQSLLYKVQGGKILNFLRFGLGDGKLNGQAIQPLTNLINPKMSLDLKRLEVKNDKVILAVFLDNKELTVGFYFRELGIFAEDPDTKEEILFMYANSDETSDYIDANTGRVIEENLTVELKVADVANITATIDESLVFATKKELDELKNEVAGIVIPTKTSELEKDDVYDKTEIDTMIGDVESILHRLNSGEGVT